jgi:hypothetical protein
MTAVKWNVARFAMGGAAIGLLYGLYRGYAPIVAGGEAMAYGIGSVVGGTIGGAFIAAAAAAIRNYFVK